MDRVGLQIFSLCPVPSGVWGNVASWRQSCFSKALSTDKLVSVGSAPLVSPNCWMHRVARSELLTAWVNGHEASIQ